MNPCRGIAMMKSDAESLWGGPFWGAVAGGGATPPGRRTAAPPPPVDLYKTLFLWCGSAVV